MRKMEIDAEPELNITETDHDVPAYLSRLAHVVAANIFINAETVGDVERMRKEVKFLLTTALDHHLDEMIAEPIEQSGWTKNGPWASTKSIKLHSKE